MMYPVDEDDDGDMSESGRSCTKSDTENNDSQLDIDEDEDNQAAHKMELRKRKERTKEVKQGPPAEEIIARGKDCSLKRKAASRKDSKLSMAMSYACTVCNKSFTAWSGCIRHIAEQHSEFSWKCRNCNKKFHRNTPRGPCHKNVEDFIRIHKTKEIQGDEANKLYEEFLQTKARELVRQVDKRKPRDENVNIKRNIHEQQGKKRKRDRVYFSFNPCFSTALSSSSDSTVVNADVSNMPVQSQLNNEGIKDLSSSSNQSSSSSDSTVVNACVSNLPVQSQVNDEGIQDLSSSSNQSSSSSDSTVVYADLSNMPGQSQLNYEGIRDLSSSSNQSSSSSVAADSAVVTPDELEQPVQNHVENENMAIGEELHDDPNIGLPPVQLRNVEENLIRDGIKVVERQTDKFVLEVAGVKIFTSKIVLRNSPTLVKLMAANPNEKELFIDRDNTTYNDIVNYLRCMQSKQQYPDSLLPRDSTILTKMMLECEYLQLPELQNLAKTRKDKFMGENQDN